MMVKADADKGGEMKVQYLTMEAQQKLLAKKSDTPKKIISEVIGLAPKTNISKDWSIRGLQHGNPFIQRCQRFTNHRSHRFFTGII